MLTSEMDNSNSTNKSKSNMISSTIGSGINNDNGSSRNKNSNTTRPICAPEPTDPLFKVVARNLRNFHGVKSMTAPTLEKIMVILQLDPRRLVTQGLAPRKFLDRVLVFSPRVSGDSSEEDVDERALSEGVVMSREEAVHMDTTETEEMNADREQEETSDNDGEDEKETQEEKETRFKHPVHAALVAGGVQLPPHDIKPLLRALDVTPHHFGRLGLIDRKALRPVQGERGSDRFPRQCGLDGLYHRARSMSNPQHSLLHGPLHLRRGHFHAVRGDDHGSRFGGGMRYSVSPPHGPCHPGRHQRFLDSEDEGKHDNRMHGPPCTRGSPIHRTPGCRGAPRRRRGGVRMRYSFSPPYVRGDLRNFEHRALLSESEEEDDMPMPGAGFYHPKRMHYSGHGPKGRVHHGRVPPFHGALARPRPFRHHLYEESEEDRDLMVHGQPPRAPPRDLDLGHRGAVYWCAGSLPPRGRYGCPMPGLGGRGVHGSFPGPISGRDRLGMDLTGARLGDAVTENISSIGNSSSRLTDGVWRRRVGCRKGGVSEVTLTCWEVEESMLDNLHTRGE